MIAEEAKAILSLSDNIILDSIEDEQVRLYAQGFIHALHDSAFNPGKRLSVWQRNEVYSHSPDFASGYADGVSAAATLLNQMRQIKAKHFSKSRSPYGVLPINMRKR